MRILHKSQLELKAFLGCIIILFGSILFGYLLIAMIYTIDGELLRENINTSGILLAEEGKYPKEKYSNRQIDNVADSVMLLVASYEGKESFFQKAANSYFVHNKDINAYDWITGNYDKQEYIAEINPYSWYWHGYILFLRPLLLMFDYGQIRYINTVCLCFLLVLFLGVMNRKIPKCTIPFILAVLLLAPSAIANCMEFSPVVYIMLIISLIVLVKGDDLSSKGLIFLFLMSGITTTYFDFLTAPTITLTVPLTVLCIQREGKEYRKKIVISCVFSWFMGFTGMWVGKWIIAFIFRYSEFVEQLVTQLKFRTSSIAYSNVSISRFEIVKILIDALLENTYINKFIIGYTVVVVVGSIINRQNISFLRLYTALLLLIPIIIVFCWYYLIANHSSWHHFFTYRSAAPCVFALLCALDLGNINDALSPKRQKTPFSPKHI